MVRLLLRTAGRKGRTVVAEGSACDECERRSDDLVVVRRVEDEKRLEDHIDMCVFAELLH